MSSRKSAPPTRDPHESSTIPCTGSQHDSVTMPHDSLCASLSGRPMVLTHSRPHPPLKLRHVRSSGVKVADLHDGSSIAIHAHDKSTPKKRKGQCFQSIDKHPYSRQRILSVPDAPLVPAAEPAPPPPASQGHPPSLSNSSSISNSSAPTVRASSNPAYHPSNEFSHPVNDPHFDLTRPGYYGVPNALEQTAGLGHDSPRFGRKPTPFYDPGT